MALGKNNSFKIDEGDGNSANTKIFAIYNESASSGCNPSVLQSKAIVGFKSDVSYNKTIQSLPRDMYVSVAGTDLSSIFYPYIASSGDVAPSGNMPGFIADIPASSMIGLSVNTLYTTMPFEIKNEPYNFVQDRAAISSGDGIRSNLSGENYLGNPDQFRSLDDQRSIGLRLPLVGVGWGKTTWGDPFPSGQGSGYGEDRYYTFRGGHREGYKVNPNEYVAAPIDLRYDPRNHVWTSPKGFWALVSGLADPNVASGCHGWQEVIFGSSGTYSLGDRRGDNNFCPAYEVNRVATSGIVYIYPKENRDYFLFSTGGGGSGSVSLDVPNPTQAGQVLLSISANQFRWLEPISLG